MTTAEHVRLQEQRERKASWKKWGPYLSERQWGTVREDSSDVATEFMPRIATTMYATMRSEAGQVVDAKVWKVSAKGLRESADRCRDTPQAPFWEATFKPIMDEAVAD